MRALEDIPIKDTDNNSHTAQLNKGNDTFEDKKEDNVEPVSQAHST